jgi:hypothetical protein
LKGGQIRADDIKIFLVELEPGTQGHLGRVDGNPRSALDQHVTESTVLEDVRVVVLGREITAAEAG